MVFPIPNADYPHCVHAGQCCKLIASESALDTILYSDGNAIGFSYVSACVLGMQLQEIAL